MKIQEYVALAIYETIIRYSDAVQDNNHGGTVDAILSVNIMPEIFENCNIILQNVFTSKKLKSTMQIKSEINLITKYCYFQVSQATVVSRIPTNLTIEVIYDNPFVFMDQVPTKIITKPAIRDIENYYA